MEFGRIPQVDEFMMVSALKRQRQIFLGGVGGRRPRVPIDTFELEQAAKWRLSSNAYAYIAGGAGAEHTVMRNRTAFERWAIVPRMLRNVSEYELQIDLLGKKHPTPFLLAPIGVLDMAHRQADRAVGRAASAEGIPYIFSNQASVPMEDVAGAMGNGTRWFQLYWSKNRELVASFVRRAEACGCEGLVVTLDTTMLGWRARDLDLAYLPFLRGRGIAQYTSDPVFQRMLDEPEVAEADAPKRRLSAETLRTVVQLMRNYPDSLLRNLRTGRPMRAVRTFIATYTNPALQWDDLPFLRAHTQLPILLKGILHPDDARRALDAGVDGLIVSNHGGRQVDGAISSIEALPDIVEAVADQVPVLLDSGIRTGADVFKALALGARAVCIGRPYAYGLAIDGERGVRAVLQNLKADFELTMRLSGCRNVREINRECLMC